MIDVAPVPESKIIKNRLPLRPSRRWGLDGRGLKRLLQLRARRVDVGQPPDASWVVLADLKAMSSACWRGLFKKLSSRTEPR